MVHQTVTTSGRRTLPAQQRQDARAVLSGVLRQFRSQQFCTGGEEIELANDIGAARPGWRHARPANDERNAMPPLKCIRLCSTKARARVVAEVTMPRDVS